MFEPFGSQTAFGAVAGQPEREREVAVPDENEVAFHLAQALVGYLDREHVLPHGIPRARMEERRVRARARRLELPEEGARVVFEHLPGPARAHARVVREDVDVDLPEDGEVVVADEADVGALGDEAAALVRTRPVPYEVTQAPDLVRRLGIDRFEHRLEGMQVPVNVADDAGAHTRRRTLTKAAVGIGLAAVWIGVAAWLWRTEVPGDLDLPSLDPGAFFSADHLSRAERWGRGSRILYFVRLAVELAVVALFVWKGKALAGWLQRWTKGPRAHRPWSSAGSSCSPSGSPGGRSARSGTGASASTGSRNQGYDGWFLDSARSVGVELVLYGIAVAGAVWLAARFGRRWWLVASPILVALSVVFILVQPLILQPLCERLPAAAGQESRRRGAAARRDQMGVDVETVEVSDASRRTTVPNAYVAGIGPTRRVVFDDTILDGRFDEAELLSVTAHELAHVERRHLWKGLAWFALLAIPGLALVAWVTERHGGLRDPGVVPLGAARRRSSSRSLTMPLQNVVSRRYEAEADWLALVATNDPDAMIGLQTGLTASSVSNPDPPTWSRVLFSTHPTSMQRIAMAEAYRTRP